ncbi:MAG: FAD binding domain-containing protein [Treponema sp.]|jgi:CO/xanthine dehydrogenase FAD-binding subunit|nr:FAD binding domain-containing protein [Treponema sp.]
MDAAHNQVVFPANLPELFAAWERFPGAALLAGGTGLIRGRGHGALLNLPDNIISLDRLEELRGVTRTERYLEIGAMISLNGIIRLGKPVPEALSAALREIAGPEVRNLASIGGNICHEGCRLGSCAPLVALDARYELRTTGASRWVSAARFAASPGGPALDPREVLSRIRIPLEQWDYTVYRKFPGKGDAAGAMVCIAALEKDILSDIRLVFAGDTLLRDRSAEISLAGKRLPLDRREAARFTALWEEFLSKAESPGPLRRSQILLFVEQCVMQLTDY